MISAWARAGAPPLGLPEPPAPLAERVHLLEPDRWGTLEHAVALTGLAGFFHRFADGLSDDYVLAGIEEVGGIDAVHYALSYGRIGLFVQTPLGDPDGVLVATAQLQHDAISAALNGLLDGRLAVLWMHYSLRGWRWYPDGGHAFEEGGRGPFGATVWLSRHLDLLE